MKLSDYTKIKFGELKRTFIRESINFIYKNWIFNYYKLIRHCFFDKTQNLIAGKWQNV